MSQQRPFNFMKHPDIFRAMSGLSAGFENSTLEPAVIELVKPRASQINGCGFCVDMHTKDARLEGETEQRLFLLSVWREAPGPVQRSRASRAGLGRGGDQAGKPACAGRGLRSGACKFNDEELARLTLVVVAINGWNRFNIAFNVPAGNYKAGSLKAMRAQAS